MQLANGYKHTEVGVIPEDWVVKPLGEVISALESGVSVNSSESEQSLSHNAPAILKTSAVEEGHFQPHECKAIVTRDIERARLHPRRDSILISRMNTIDLVGECGFVRRDYPTLFVPDRLWMTRFRAESDVSAQWMSYVLSSTEYRKKLKTIATGTSGSMKNIAKSSLLSLAFAFPPSEEQRAIAEALSDVDALINAVDALITKKRHIKQGTMQKLLTGKKRLPGFSGEWEEKTLGELTTFLSGGTPSRSNDDYWAGDIPWISASSLRCFEIWRSDSNVTEEAVSAGSKMAPVGTTLLLVRGSALHKEILCGLVTKPVCFNQDVKALVPQSQMVPIFLTIVIKGRAEDFLKLVSSAGNTAGVLDTKLLKAFEIKLPNPDEQTAIAEVLSDMDAEITALEQKRDKTKLIKQGMMQELLTGKTRLI